jgi:hypothetical protein
MRYKRASNNGTGVTNMTLRVHPETFTVTETIPNATIGEIYLGTIEADIAGKRQTIEAKKFYDGEIYLIGFVGRYRTSPKPWKATVSLAPGAALPYVFFGRDDRCGRFHKATMISYQPETYKALDR